MTGKMMRYWLTMWTCPRTTIRRVVDENPKLGVLRLVFIFMLQNLLFYANWWSFGLRSSSLSIVIWSIILSPFAGLVWVYFAGWIFYFTGRWLQGSAPASHLRSALAWSKVPAAAALAVWILLIALNPQTVFVLDGKGASVTLILFISLTLGIWSFVLLVQAIREIQHFSVGKSIINIVMGWVVYYLFIMIFIILFRYFYLLSI